MTNDELDNLKVVTKRLNDLLSNPQPGLSTWQSLVRIQIRTIAMYLNHEELTRLIHG